MEYLSIFVLLHRHFSDIRIGNLQNPKSFGTQKDRLHAPFGVRSLSFYWPILQRALSRFLIFEHFFGRSGQTGDPLNLRGDNDLGGFAIGSLGEGLQSLDLHHTVGGSGIIQ